MFLYLVLYIYSPCRNQWWAPLVRIHSEFLILHGSSIIASRKTALPTCKFKEDIAYKTWKNKLSMWILVTNVPKKGQAIVVLLEALEGNQKAEKAVSDLTATRLNVDDGLRFYLINLIQPFKQKLWMIHTVHIQNLTTTRKVIIHP